MTRINSVLDDNVRFDLEAFLQAHFGLEGPFFTGRTFEEYEQIDEEIRPDVFDFYYTPDGLAAFTRAVELIRELEKLGIIDGDIALHIHCRLHDNA